MSVSFFTSVFKPVFGIVVIFLCLAACGQEPAPTPAPTLEPTAALTATNTPTLTPSPTETPTITPTPGPLSPAEIFENVSPSIVYIETPAGSGSGMLMEGGYIVTNAHVVWPFDMVRVVFPDGSEFEETSVVAWDLMVDLAVVGPLETAVSPLTLVDGESLVIGSDVYLIGYPGEVDEFPEPTITRGLISRLREWEAVGVTYFQTDADIAGGQSGGVLVSEKGEVIGISGFRFTEAQFGLVASAADIAPRIPQLIAGEDSDELGERRFFAENGRSENEALLNDRLDSAIFALSQPLDTEVEIELSGDGDGTIRVIDSYGRFIAQIDDTFQDEEVGSFTIESELPYFIIIEQNEDTLNRYEINSSHPLFSYSDADDGRTIQLGDVAAGNVDYPGDVDYFIITLQAGQVININVDSVLIDPFVAVDYLQSGNDDTVLDDDSGGGMFGLSAELSYEAPISTRYTFIVFDASFSNMGGYIFSVDEPSEGDPTPIAPEPTATPSTSPFGLTILYESQNHPFAFYRPANWLEHLQNCPSEACFAPGGGSIVYVDEFFSTQADSTLEEVVETAVIPSLDETYLSFELLSLEYITTETGLPGAFLTFTLRSGGASYSGAEFVYLHEGIGVFTITLFAPTDSYTGLEDIFLYTFNTLFVQEE